MADDLTVENTPIPGLLVISIPLLNDARGWFKENWQREKMVAAGLPDFRPIQNNMSFNGLRGTTRGIHAEPWDKLISVAHGRIFGAWVDLRAGDSFGTVFSVELGPETAVFVPRGVGNSYQTLEDNTVYTYLVNEHWRADALYRAVNLADETAAINWPIPLDEVEISDKDRENPRLADVEPMQPRKTLIIGGNGQLGRALRVLYPDADAPGSSELDLRRPETFQARDWRQYDTIINAAGFTNVDAAETVEGRREAWLINVTGVAALARIAIEHNLTLVHVSSDYVFDGEADSHSTTEGFSPLGVYGQTKAAGDAVVSTVPRHYIIRTSWVIGDGPNFIRTMQDLAARGVEPKVVDDQFGRITHTEDLAAGIRSLLDGSAPYGTHHLTSGGPVTSWFDVAQDVFAKAGRDPNSVTPISTEEYSAGKAVSPRPRNSILD